jgi:hypothetical protein
MLCCPASVTCIQELSEWACIYIRYLQIFRKLETAYDQMLQPQKRQDMKKALEACMGRMLEIRHWMVCVLGPMQAPSRAVKTAATALAPLQPGQQQQRRMHAT